MTAGDLRILVRLGRYREVARAFADPAEAAPSDPWCQLERCRALVMQGYISLAGTVLDSLLADPRPASDAWPLLAIERAAVRVFADLDYARALDDGNGLVEAARAAGAAPVLLARLERIWARIVHAANVHGEAPPELADAMTGRLAAAAQALVQADELEESLLVRLTALSAGMEQPWADADGLARDALAAGWPSIAADAFKQKALTQRQRAAPPAEVRATLGQALELYQMSGHAHGALDIALQRAFVDDDEGLEVVSRILDIGTQYEAQDHVRGLYEALHGMVAILQEQGIAHRAAPALQALEDLPRRIGLGLALPNFALRSGELMQRQGRFAEAIVLLRKGLAANPPLFLRASLEQVLAQTYAILGLSQNAEAHRSRAAKLLARAPARSLAASLAEVVAQAERLNVFDLATWHQEAQALLASPAPSPGPLKELVDRFLQRRQAGDDLTADPELHRTLQALLDRAAAAMEPGPWRKSKQLQGNLLQLRAHVSLLAGSTAGALDAQRRAVAVFDQGRLSMYVANSRYMEGVIHLQQALAGGATAGDHLDPAERALRDALSYYAEAKMRRQAADTRVHLARLGLFVCGRVAEPARDRLVSAVLELLEQAEADVDGLRQDFLLADALETQDGKLALVRDSERGYDLAVRACLVARRDVAAAWDWARRSKSRVLLDLLVRSPSPAPGRPSVPRAAGEVDPHRPGLGEILSAAAGSTPGSPPVVLADWKVQGDAILAFTIRSGDANPVAHQISLSPAQVRDFVAEDMDRDPVTRFRDGNPGPFYDLAPLIAPLAQVLQPGDRLLLSPSGAMGRLPLHALPLDGQPLIARHPVAYLPSLDLLPALTRHTRLPADPPNLAFFGDPTGDVPVSRALLAELARDLGGEARFGSEVTAGAFLAALAQADLVHFHGHAEFSAGDPLDSGLHLQGGKLVARDLFRAERGRARLVILAACQSAVGADHPGDENLGLLRALFYAGAQAVVGTLWRVPGAATAALLRAFYAALLPPPPAPRPSVAEALRQAILAVRGTASSARLYHWAAFYVSGDAL